MLARIVVLLVTITLAPCADARNVVSLGATVKASDFADHVFRGVTLAELQPDGIDPYSEGDFVDLATAGANLVRVFLPIHHCDGCANYNIAEAQMSYVERILKYGENLGFRVVVTLVPLPGFAKAEYWMNQSLRDDIAAKWQVIASRLRPQRALAAYDLINEPVPPKYLPKILQQMQWRDFSSQLIRALRAVDPGRVIIVEPSPWAFPNAFRDLEPLPFPNIVYSFHLYQPRGLTHQGLYDEPLGVSYPSSDWDKTRLSEVLEPVRQFAKQTGAPIFVGEFSCVRWTPADGSARYIHDAIELFEAEGWSWAYHAWRAYQGWDVEIPSSVPREQQHGHLPQFRSVDTPAFIQLKKGLSLNPAIK